MKIIKPGLIFDNERIVGGGQTSDRFYLCLESNNGFQRTVTVIREDLDQPMMGMPGYIERIKASLPELPEAKRQRYQSVYGLSVYDSQVMASDPETAQYFDAVIEYCGDGKSACNWVMGSWMALLKRDGITLKECPVSAENLGELINLINTNIITHNLAKQIFEKMWNEKLNPREVIEKYDMVQKQDSGGLEILIDSIIAADTKALEEYRKGKEAIVGHFVGKVMKETKGKSNPKIVNEIVKSKLLALK